MVNPQVSWLNLTLETDIPGDFMWSLIDCKHTVPVPHHDGNCLWIWLMIVGMRRLTEEQRILFDASDDNPVKENGGAEVDISLSRPKYVF